MKKLYILTILSALLITIASCEENKMDTYKNDPAIYFEKTTSNQRDSIKHTFYFYDESITEDTVRVVICTMGEPTDYDRPISLIQTNTGKPDAAIAGTHYIPFDDPSLKKYICIPAGQVRAEIPIVFLRDKSLKLQEVRLELTVGKNDFFRPGINEQRNFFVTTNDLIAKPSNWDTRWKTFFGITWGPVKMKLIIDSTGYTDFENPPLDYGYLYWLSATAQQALLDYNTAHPDNPLCEADGTPVTFE